MLKGDRRLLRRLQRFACLVFIVLLQHGKDPLRTRPERIFVAAKVRKTVAKLSKASCQQYHTITDTVPMMVRTPENREGSAEETVVEIFSMSLVIRLITSPWEWVSPVLSRR